MLLILACACGSVKSKAQPSPWPASTPEEQGMDSAQLLKLLDIIDTDNIHSILIIRHGRTVLELYYPPFSVQDRHMLFSATKSVTSALVGIAIQEGRIQSADQNMLDFFSDRTSANLDERKKNIHLHDLLNMTSGLTADDMKMGASSDWTQFTLDQPMNAEPGTVFDYNTGNTQLLSAIIQKATGKAARAYAQEKLFTPLGIQDVYWAADDSGITQGGIGLMLTPRDMARFGYLYLHQGKWGEVQVVPAEWVQKSVRENANQYAFQWWQSDKGFAAIGYAGQIIYVIPKLDLVAVFTAALPADQASLGIFLTDALIIPAIKSEQALPESPDTQNLLQRVEEISNPKPLPMPVLPAIVESINGKTLLLDENSIGWESAKLTFKDKQAWITIKIKDESKGVQYPMGINGLWVLSPVGNQSSELNKSVAQRNFLNPYEFGFLIGMPVDGQVAMKGEWIDESTFRLNVQDIRDFDREQILFSFTSAGAKITWSSFMDGIRILNVNGKFE